MKTRVLYVISNEINTLQDEVNKELEALQVNSKITIEKIDTTVGQNTYIVQVTYNESEDIPQILNEDILVKGVR
jgi:hypothetical protein